MGPMHSVSRLPDHMLPARHDPINRLGTSQVSPFENLEGRLTVLTLHWKFL
jgi:hypothetical protein